MKRLIVLIFLCSFSIPCLADQKEPVVLSTPVSTSEYFPCSKCHEKTKTALQQKNFHDTICVETHIEESFECYGCHDPENLDKLQLFNGEKIELSVSSQLCGQCHSTNFKLWESGLHGKVVGNWNGPQKITPCTICHDPHRPQYTGQQPEKPPVHPKKTLR